ncbi:unnamed protein product [Blepharisma stoltei]|uniref:BAH domain-containing protein n=1 Tax=Blepharisma stoltei TaxID=1481888 RepID=A0AAU9I9C2_9CILI|nr:unnamed protein product [Blepharisma stoltei]
MKPSLLSECKKTKNPCFFGLNSFNLGLNSHSEKSQGIQSGEASNDFQFTRDPGPDIYFHLSTHYSPLPVNIRIPETLIRAPGLSSPVFLYWENQSVQAYQKKDAFSTFIATTEKFIDNSSLFPSYIHSNGKSKVTLCKNSKHAIRIWAECKDDYQILQRYVAPKANQVEKLRVYWYYSEPTKFYLIRNKASAINLGKSSTLATKIPMVNSSYMYQTKDYAFAGRILKTSFSPSFPFRPKLSKSISPVSKSSSKILNISSYYIPLQNGPGNSSPTHSQNTSKIINSSTLDLSSKPKEFEKDLYIVKSRKGGINVEVVVIENENEVEKMMNFMVGYLENCIIMPENTKIVELIADFMQDRNDDWFLLRCKAHKIDYIHSGNRAKYKNKRLSGVLRSLNSAKLLAEALQIHEENRRKNVNSMMNSLKRRLDSLIQQNSKIPKNYAYYSPKESVQETRNIYLAERRASRHGTVPILMIGTDDDLPVDDINSSLFSPMLKSYKKSKKAQTKSEPFSQVNELIEKISEESLRYSDLIGIDKITIKEIVASCVYSTINIASSEVRNVSLQSKRRLLKIFESNLVLLGADKEEYLLYIENFKRLLEIPDD